MPDRKLALFLPGPTLYIVIARVFVFIQVKLSEVCICSSSPETVPKMILFLKILAVNQGLNSPKMWMRDTDVITVPLYT